MYFLTTPLTMVSGVGPALASTLAEREISTVRDLLLFLPLNYEDRSQKVRIGELKPGELVTFVGEVKSASNFYKGRRSIQSATVADETGRVKLMWFNNKFIIDKLKKGQSYLFSGKLNDRGTITQPVVEDIKTFTLHTGRLVPRYSQLGTIKQGNVRRLFKEIFDHLTIADDQLKQLSAEVQDLKDCLFQLHFPEEAEGVIQARQRLALEEMVGLIQQSHELKKIWKAQETGLQITIGKQKIIPETIPFTLTGDQHKAVAEILEDLQRPQAMNRLLVGDVGSGKTVVAGLAARQVLANGYSAVLVAPTRILANQHAQTLQKLFPDLPIKVITAQQKFSQTDEPALYIGTHAVFKRLAEIKAALLIYDEQHRFGVLQRSQVSSLEASTHVLTMSATPIPRTLMLTVFSHLDLSAINELPAGRIPTKTWVIGEAKRKPSLEWIAESVRLSEESSDKQLAMIICPFIDPSNSVALENVAAVTERFEALRDFYDQLPPDKYHPRLGLLHGRLKKKAQDEVIADLYAGKIDILVTTPIVEVGVDLPTASIMVIEAAERFGLASLHQLRGRVGRAGQQGYCLLFTSNGKPSVRLTKFSETLKGTEIAQLDLEYRGAGDIFGTEQHGFDNLRFANWADAELIQQAREIFTKLNGQPYQSLILPTEVETEKQTLLPN